ncbi:conserved Plasmodium protein, unknown function [Plasmodium relictum]|uniref:Uncharacterized protein n=1 Tax=Plasmodium relictum TaxID=85471 RepID=A0A1J1H6L5_PLARL|nr:conserved Plasmodium protein, unknown function [Plasmodium relictum]CRH00188.1 conserved Plasmodium protein, unknown function [Plasmodium relictum]
MINKSKSKSFILFEGENEINYKNFCYDYSEELVRKRTLDFQSHKSLNGKSKLDKWSSKDKIEFNYDSLIKLQKLSTKCNKFYIDLLNIRNKEELTVFYSLNFLQSKLNLIAKHDFKNFLNYKDQEKCHKIPMLWIHDHKTTYSTSKKKEKIEIIK